jgi:hypothetical protein
MRRRCAFARGRGGSAAGASRPLQAGQAMMEFALFFTFMMLVLAGVTDVAFLEDAHVNVVFAARQGARTGAVLDQGTPTGPSVDCAIVGAIQATLLSQSDVTLNQITIFQAGANGVPTGNQQIYSGTDSCTSANSYTLTPLSGSNWPPSARNDTPFTEDSLGVKLDYTFTFRFNLWQGGTLNLSDSSVFPLNPAGFPSPVPSPTP